MTNSETFNNDQYYLISVGNSEFLLQIVSPAVVAIRRSVQNQTLIQNRIGASLILFTSVCSSLKVRTVHSDFVVSQKEHKNHILAHSHLQMCSSRCYRSFIHSQLKIPTLPYWLHVFNLQL